MTARANWHVGETSIEVADDDPFGVPIEEVGQRIDLRDPQAGLELRLRELVYREGNLAAGGVTCPIKDRGDTCCHACPVSRAGSDEDPLGVLCRVGREQEAAATEMAVLEWRGR